MEQFLLDGVLEQFRGRGLLKKRGRQRTDSTHVQAAVRTLNRLECVGETLRHALNSLAEVAPQWLGEHIPQEWYERYDSHFEQHRLPKTEGERESVAVRIGQDGRQLLEWVYALDAPEGLKTHPAIEILRQVWVQQYYLQDGRVAWRQADSLPPSERAIQSPYDPEARYSQKRQTEWVGYKVTVLIESQERYRIEAVGPVRVDSTWQAQSGKGFDASRFVIDWEQGAVTCWLDS